MINRPKLSIIIPVYNEGNNLKVLLRILKAMVGTSHEVLVVYDIPDDDSIPVVMEFQKHYNRLKLVHNRLGRGVINAIKTGVNNAIGHYALIIAADDIGPTLIIDNMAFLMDDGCDLVNATRYSHGGRNIGGNYMSRLLSRAANSLFHILSGCGLTDPTLGVKMFKRSKFSQINLESKPIGWAVSFEFAIKAQAAGWKLGEVPVVSLNRVYGKGKSSFRLGWTVEYIKWFVWGLKELSFNHRSKVKIKIPQ